MHPSGGLDAPLRSSAATRPSKTFVGRVASASERIETCRLALRHRVALEVEPRVGVARLVAEVGRRCGTGVRRTGVVDAEQRGSDRLDRVVAQLAREVAGDLVALA